MDYLKQLDILLAEIAKVDIRERTEPRLHEDFDANPIMKKIEVYAALRKLVKDGYVTSTIHTVENSGLIGVFNEKTTYIINFEGKLFLKSGGYQRAEMRAKIKTVAYGLNIFILCVAAIVATLYYWGEIRQTDKSPLAPFAPHKEISTNRLDTLKAYHKKKCCECHLEK